MKHKKHKDNEYTHYRDYGDVFIGVPYVIGIHVELLDYVQ